MKQEEQHNLAQPVWSREQELLALYEIGKAVNSTLDLDKVLNIIISETIGLFQADAGSIMLLNADNELTIKAAQGLTDDIVKNTRVRPGEGIAGWVAETGQILLLDGRVSDPRFRNLVDRKEDIPSSLCVPLKRKDKIIGVLMIRRTGEVRFSDHHSRLISLIAEQVAITIENAALFEQEKRRTEELQELNRAVKLEKSKMETILTSMADGVVVTSVSGEISMINRAGCKMLDIPEAEAIGKHFDRICAGKQIFDNIRESVCRRKVRYKTDFSRESPGGEIFLHLVATALSESVPGNEGIVIVIQNITEMKKIDRMKSEFVSMVSHELRTPLTAIMGFAELMISREFNAERRHRYLEIIMQDSSRLMRLINNLLDLSKLEAGQITFNFEPVNITEMIPGLIESFESQKAGHELTYGIDGEIPEMMLDRDMFLNIMVNLVSNAIKYSPDGGNINILLHRNSEAVVVSVSDQGIGIAQEKIPLVFDKFYRVDSALNRETGGTGLGLATVKYIVEGFGGKIWVESELGKGSRFIFTLPLEA
ncbi:MAG: ATP-binding protein [Firmicutes bacterium]|nr:ATP-binding protein [Bacillota bacterium]